MAIKNTSSETDKSNKTDVKQQTKTIGSVGVALRDARKKQKVSLDKVSSDLYIKIRQLEALEEDRFDDLPQYAFTRGFAVKYAEYLNLNKDDIINRFDACYPDEKKIKKAKDIESPMRVMGTVTRDNKIRFNFNPVLLLSVIGVIILAFYLWGVVSKAEDEHNAPKEVEQPISQFEQRQGASVGNVGSAINLDKDEESKTESNQN